MTRAAFLYRNLLAALIILVTTGLVRRSLTMPASGQMS